MGFFSKKQVLLACFLASPAFGQTGWGLPQLMAGLAQVKSASARFTEMKTMAVLSAPLAATGTLDYAAPDWMEKTTLTPVPERFTLDGGQITITSGQDGRTQVFSAQQNPLIGGLTEGIVDTLAGNLPALRRAYDVQFSGGPGDWQLVLRPLDPAVTRFIAWMCIRGGGNRIASIVTESANGDHSEMSIAETVSSAR